MDAIDTNLMLGTQATRAAKAYPMAIMDEDISCQKVNDEECVCPEYSGITKHSRECLEKRANSIS